VQGPRRGRAAFARRGEPSTSYLSTEPRKERRISSHIVMPVVPVLRTRSSRMSGESVAAKNAHKTLLVPAAGIALIVFRRLRSIRELAGVAADQGTSQILGGATGRPVGISKFRVFPVVGPTMPSGAVSDLLFDLHRKISGVTSVVGGISGIGAKKTSLSIGAGSTSPSAGRPGQLHSKTHSQHCRPNGRQAQGDVDESSSWTRQTPYYRRPHRHRRHNGNGGPADPTGAPALLVAAA